MQDRLKQVSYYKITDEFMQSFDQAKEQAKPVENLAAAENQLKSIEKDIKALGPVNVDAIEQYDEVKGRFDFLLASGRMSWPRKTCFCLPSTT